SSTHSIHLDALRGIAALFVVGYHVRILFFVDRGAVLGSSSLGADLFYSTTAIAREAILSFFVLSGFLIANSIHQANRQGRWSAAEYAISRLSRLYVVLLPALLLGLLWDLVGLHWLGSADIYTGHLANHEFPIDVAAQLTPASVFGTLIFV